jgi:hypothetical protein
MRRYWTDGPKRRPGVTKGVDLSHPSESTRRDLYELVRR